MNTVVTTNADGSITRLTMMHPHTFHYGWLALGLLAVALVAWGLRLLFWQRDSN